MKFEPETSWLSITPLTTRTHHYCDKHKCLNSSNTQMRTQKIKWENIKTKIRITIKVYSSWDQKKKKKRSNNSKSILKVGIVQISDHIEFEFLILWFWYCYLV